jgi:hypothetical protein
VRVKWVRWQQLNYFRTKFQELLVEGVYFSLSIIFVKAPKLIVGGKCPTPPKNAP